MTLLEYKKSKNLMCKFQIICYIHCTTDIELSKPHVGEFGGVMSIFEYIRLNKVLSSYSKSIRQQTITLYDTIWYYMLYQNTSDPCPE